MKRLILLALLVVFATAVNAQSKVATINIKSGFNCDHCKKCESCGGEMEKQWSLSGFQFKGAGWYVTDYAAKKGAKTDGSGKTEKGSSGESTDKSGDASKSKSEAAPAPKKDGGST